MTSPNPFRLPRTIVPRAYRIFLTPDLEGATFTGRVEIDVEVTEPVERVTMHAKNLVLGPATLTGQGTSRRSDEPAFDETYETVTFAFAETIPDGPATLEIAFSGVLNDQLAGFYRSTYTDDAGVAHVIATTQFEQSDARQAFPCWDEPSFKATYQVNLTVPSHLAAISNSPEVENVDLGNGQRSVRFAPTMVMSTYLVAFVVGPFEFTEAVDVDGVPLRVVYPVGKGHLTALALEAGAFALRYFSEYFAIPYPGEKLDMVAIPDFANGAMENLGCVTYRENALLVDPATASLAEVQRVAEVVHHEIAHMWFGDLVTMEWWEGIWLNEAFATFMQLLCTDAFRPEYRIWTDQAVLRDQSMHVDGLASTRSIEYEVISPDDTQGMFDLLTYEKGGSVLRMLEQYLGATTFRDSIRHYLAQHAYANTVTGDLWDALELVSGQPVREMMDTWILQGGHPIVTLANGALSQSPFIVGDPANKGAVGDRWLVPVLTRSLDGGPISHHLLGDTPVAVTDAAPVVVNAGGWGYFRSRYASADLAALAARLDELDELERAMLVADTWALLFAGEVTWRDFYTVAAGLGAHNEPIPWGFVAAAVTMIERALPGPAREVLAREVRELAEPQFARLGWDRREDESVLTGQLRAIVIGLLGMVCNDDAIIAEARRRFEADTMDGDLALTILRITAHHGSVSDYDTFLERYRVATSPQESLRYQLALGAFSDEKIALDAAERCFSEFRSQDAPLVLVQLMRNETTGPTVWRYLASRWDEAIERFSRNLHARLAAALPTFVNDAALADEVEAFHRAHPVVGGYPATVDQQLELMRAGQAFAAAIRQQF
ncbi:MAG: M1 family metallopeptidase [Actinomycetales bacterium]|nr:M1 family metallopeptidase [Actinomycetales bacterium]